MGIGVEEVRRFIPDAAPNGPMSDQQRVGELFGVNRLVPLDALRGIAILLVIIHHVWWRFPAAHADPLVRFLAIIGWAGVDLFFGISGYLITTILMKSAGLGAVRAFFIKRFFRIIPIYALALLVFAAVSLVFGNDRDVISRIWINALLLTAWFIPFLGENGVPFTITWSVSVEEFAYLLFGMLAAVTINTLVKSLPWIVALAFVIRAISIFLFAFEPITLYYFAPGRIDAIAMGGLLAAASPRLSARLSVPVWIPWLTWIVVVAACAVMKRESVAVATIGYTLIAFASAWLVLCVVRRSGSSHWWITRWLAELGTVSYFVYLFHGFVIGAVALFVPTDLASYLGHWGLTVVVSVVVFLGGKMSWRYLEYPLIVRGRRIAEQPTVKC